MAGKNSFAIWASPCDTHLCQHPDVKCPKRSQEQINRETIRADLHINVWRIPNTISNNFFKNNGSKSIHCLDLGFMIYKPNSISCVNIFVPEWFKDSSSTDGITDLSLRIKKIDMLCALFNDDLKIEQSFAAYQHNVIYENNPDKSFILHELTDKDITAYQEYGGTVIRISIPDTDSDKPVYIRIRLDSSALKHCTSTENLANSFLQKIFSVIEVTDLQINENRTLNKRLRDKIKKECEFEFNKINAFYICKSDNELTVFSPKYSSCRFLEKDVWRDYIDSEYLNSTSSNGVLAYHWKFPEQSIKKSQTDTSEVTQPGISHCSIMVKNKTEATSWKRILIYFLAFIFTSVMIGFSGNWVYDTFKTYSKPLVTISEPALPKK